MVTKLQVNQDFKLPQLVLVQKCKYTAMCESRGMQIEAQTPTLSCICSLIEACINRAHILCSQLLSYY